jgi:hypothetical protein
MTFCLCGDLKKCVFANSFSKWFLTLMTAESLPAVVVVDEALVAWPARRPRNFNPRIPISNVCAQHTWEDLFVA